MSKNLILMRDVINLYHPEFVKSKDLRSYGLKHYDIFNVERLVEECLAEVGNYKFVDEEGYDFDDLSDSKTVTVNRNTRMAEVNNVETKIGALRITAYNPHIVGLHYFFVPTKDLDNVRRPCYGKNWHKQRIQFTYSKKEDYGWFEQYRVGSFEELAQSAD